MKSMVLDADAAKKGEELEKRVGKLLSPEETCLMTLEVKKKSSGHARVLALPPGPGGSAVCAAALLRAPPRAAAARQCATTCVLRGLAQDSLYITVNKQDNQPSLCHEQ